MPTPEILLAFLAALLLLELSPGPDMMLVMARGMGQGRRAALFTVVGMVFVAGVVQVGLLVLGLATLVKSAPFMLHVLQWAGALYLLWLGAKALLTPASPLQPGQACASLSDWQAVKQGTINSLTNPKSLLFMFAFLPQFVDPAQGPVWLQLLILGSLQKLTGILSLGSIALASSSLRQWLLRFPRLTAWPEKFMGVVMIGLGIRLFLTDTGASTLARTR